MAEVKPIPIAAPRPPGDPTEIKFVREQAEVYYAILKDDPNYVLLPVCFWCSSEKMIEIRYDFTFLCEDCKKNSDAGIREAGRIARR